jgi:Fe2+ or Zn2+ uptake regulation protein
MSKHTKEVLEVLSKDKIQSTNEILKKLEAKTNKTINWHNLYRILMDLALENKIERLESKAGFFWKKK